MTRFTMHSWKFFACRGTLAVLVGVLALARPAVTLAALVFMFGAYAIFDGLLAIGAALRRRGHEMLWALEGVLGLAIGAMAIFRPALTALVFVNVVAFWALLSGLLELAAAFRARGIAGASVVLGLAGISSLGLGIVSLVWPLASAFTLVLFLGAYALLEQPRIQ